MTRRRRRPSTVAGPAPVRPRQLGATLGDGLLNGWAVLGYVYLFAPIIVIVVFSFNDLHGITHPFNYTWKGFTFDNWAHPFGSSPNSRTRWSKSLQDRAHRLADRDRDGRR